MNADERRYENNSAALFVRAEALAAAGQTEKAENYYGELQRAFPHKGEISTAVKNLSARRTMNEGGYDALAVIQISAADTAHSRAPDGPSLALKPLPYAVPGV